MYFLLSCLFGLILFSLCIFIHELGHYIFLKKYKIPIVSYGIGFGPTLWKVGKFEIKFFPIGAYIQPENMNDIAPAKKFNIAMAGPVMSIFYSILLMLVSFQYTNYGLDMLALFNFYFAIFNLAPIPPMDGWVMLQAIAEYFNKPMPKMAVNVANRVGNGVVWGLGFFLIAKGVGF
jgi:membrane-associated protease RseP (regulator of RpoE activity)